MILTKSELKILIKGVKVLMLITGSNESYLNKLDNLNNKLEGELKNV